LQDNLKVTRNARTYVLTIAYSNPDPTLARSIAATYASAYLEDQLESRFETSRRASAWLEDRIQEIKKKAEEADRVAQDFRVKNRLTEASGRLINEQSLTDSNTLLSQARNDLNVAKAKYDRLKQIVDSQDYGASNLDALANPIISTLRAKYLDAYKLNSDISARIGPQHDSAVRARKEMNEYSKVILQELSRLMESYQSEVQVTSERVKTLENSIEQSRKVSDVDSAAMGTLKSLENEALTYKNVYTLYLQKAQDLIQQQSIPISDARIISDAELPIKPSSPKTLLILLGSIILGFMVGGAGAMLREFRERGFRVSAQIRDELGLDFTSYLPRLSEDLFEHRSVGHDPAKAHLFKSGAKGFDIVLDDPMSHFTEALRSIKLAVDYHFGMKRPLTLGMVSTFPNEGKSTVAKNLASLVARQGESVLLIDCDLRNPHLTRSLTPTARFGLLEILSGSELPIGDAIFKEEASGLAFLPACARGRVPATGDILSSPVMASLMQRLRENFNFIVVDLAPLGAVKDASAAAAFVDGYHLVVEWGKTPRAAVADALATDPIVASRTVGVSLSKVEIDRLELYDNHAVYGYSNEYMSRYYQSSGAKSAPAEPKYKSWLGKILDLRKKPSADRLLATLQVGFASFRRSGVPEQHSDGQERGNESGAGLGSRRSEAGGHAGDDRPRG
jgi:succinoglycan biosynthesis transport protein ExoP